MTFHRLLYRRGSNSISPRDAGGPGLLPVLGRAVAAERHGRPAAAHGGRENRGGMRMSRSFALRYGVNVRDEVSAPASEAPSPSGDSRTATGTVSSTGTSTPATIPRSCRRRRRCSSRAGRWGSASPPGPRPSIPARREARGRLDNPIRFNDSDLASFGPFGTSTPGSVYLAMAASTCWRCGSQPYGQGGSARVRRQGVRSGRLPRLTRSERVQ